MYAVWFEKFGSANETLIFGELPKPQVAAGEVLIRMKTTGVNPSDVKKRAGSAPNLLDDGPVIPHSDGAGVIEAVGAGVTEQRIGERVWVYQAQFGRSFGSAAEYLAIDASRAAVLPENVSFEVGACLGIPVMTAHRCVFADGSVEGKTLLVTGGAGRVGYYAIQWAKQAGARVITTASNDADKTICENVGADLVVNHREENWSEALLALNDSEKVDRVIDVEFGANLAEVLKVIRVGGEIVTYSSTQVSQPQLPFGQMLYLDLIIRLVIVYAMPETAKQAAIVDINDKLAKGELQHRLAHVLDFDDMVKAHELIEQGGFGGCVVVRT
ncbi:MAG: NADPH:quinone reductase [Proteobacteria bacterium]|nr:NADPH:quinone reductase [Pseudomonadota bacterium]